MYENCLNAKKKTAKKTHERSADRKTQPVAKFIKNANKATKLSHVKAAAKKLIDC